MGTIYISIVLQNDTTGYLTLNSATLGDSGSDTFLRDSSYSVAPGASATVITQSWENTGVTYNITESALLQLSWNGNHIDWTLAATIQGSTEYSATGYNGPPVVTYDEGAPISTYTITVASTS